MHRRYKLILYHLGMGNCLPKKTVEPKMAGSGLGEHSKNWILVFISATIEASNFKFGTQLGFGE